ncbi:MAG: hypothetical protein IKM46_02855 [Clostridia bacterium]|nr:hypothetical protein [Clostridia bacterium]
MKTKKLSAVLIAVIITAALCVTAFAVLDIGEAKDTEKDVSAETKASEVKIERNKFTGDVYSDVVKSREITVGGKELTVSYRYSNTFGGTRSDVYLDDAGNMYYFDTDGNLTGEFPARDNTVTKNNEDSRKTLAEADYINIAEDHMRGVFGSDVDGFEYLSHEVLTSSGKYSVRFAKTIGEDGFVIADTCSVTVSADGNVTMCAKGANDPLEGFDMSLLDGVTREEVTAFTEEEAERIFEEYGIIELETVTDVGIGCCEGEYYLAVCYDLQTEKPIPNELTELYNMGVAKSADKHLYSVSMKFSLGE